jgi:hypothetical protein
MSSQTEVVSFNSVMSSPVKRQLDDNYQIELRVLLLVERNLPTPTPKINVKARCDVDGKPFEDTIKIAFKNLAGAIPMAKREDSARLFFVPGLPKKPERCEFALSLTEGALEDHYYCYENDSTYPRKCSQ